MSKVTSVERQKRNPRRFNIFLNGKFAFGVDEDTIVNFRLLPGKELLPDDLEKITGEIETGKLMERMYRLFSIRLRSEKEIRDYLRRLSYKRKNMGLEEISDVAIDKLVKRFINRGLINDKEFARLWVDARRKSKKLGPKALRMELIKKGIDRAEIDSLLNESEENNEKLAKEALEKRINRWKNLPDIEIKRKAIDYLLRKGFDYSVAKRVLKNYPFGLKNSRVELNIAKE